MKMLRLKILIFMFLTDLFDTYVTIYLIAFKFKVFLLVIIFAILCSFLCIAQQLIHVRHKFLIVLSEHFCICVGESKSTTVFYMP